MISNKRLKIYLSNKSGTEKTLLILKPKEHSISAQQREDLFKQLQFKLADPDKKVILLVLPHDCDCQVIKIK